MVEYNGFLIRTIQAVDNQAITAVIRNTLKEYAGDRPGLSYFDKELDDMAGAYANSKALYLVVERQLDHCLVGGAGFAPLAGADGSICELRKMYFLPEVRGRGLGYYLLQHILHCAAECGYRQCYLETLQVMPEANRLYQKAGFTKLDHALGKTGHFGVDVWYLKSLH